MKQLLTLVILLVTALRPVAGSTFNLKGEVTNPGENRVLVTVYRNWVEDPEDYYLYLDKQNRFSFDLTLEETAYLDFNYGLNGFLFQIIEPGDEIFVRFDNNNFYESFHTIGKGSAKWVYDQNQRERFEVKRDVEKEIIALYEYPRDIFMKSIKAYEDEQLNYLGSFRKNFSEEFFVLKRADIIGKMNQLRLDYLSPRVKDENLFEAFDLSEIHPDLQLKSFEYGNFVESLCEVQMINAGLMEDGYDLTRVYLQLKYFFEKDWLSKQMTDRILAAKLSASFLIDGYTPESEILVRDYANFATNPEYSRAISSKFAVLKGKEIGEPVPAFVLEDVNGRFISLKDLKGNYVLMLFWASWCDPCKDDLKSVPTVLNYFKGNQNIKVIQVAVDEKKDFDESLINKGDQIRNVRLDPKSKLLSSLDIKMVPSFVLIDKSGNWLETKLIEPGLDEGRGLIRQLEAIFANQ